MALPLALWISPVGKPYETVEDVLADVARVHLDGFEPVVILPTLYDDYPQQECRRTIGDALAIDSAEDAARVRAQFEAAGVRCWGWSVPRGTGDVAAEGAKHGAMAAVFETFVLNFEDGWEGFWTADGRAVVDTWLGGFWSAPGTEHLDGHVGVTMVTNSAMLHAVSDDEARAWCEGTHFWALEAYVPGDPGLDPANSLRLWRERLARIGQADRPVVLILERGDLVGDVERFAEPTWGTQIWPVESALAVNWPAAAPPAQLPAAEPEPCDRPWQAKRPLVLSSAGVIRGDLVAALRAEANRLGRAPRKTVIRRLARQIEQAAEAILA